MSDVSRVAWLHPEDMDYSEWVVAGRRLGATGRGSQWWIGDWIRYGTAKWGEKYAEAARITGYDRQSLRNLAWVASRFDLSRRRDNLTWTHHAELAALEPDQQEEWLERAVALKLSAADLRVELRSLRRGRKPVADGDHDSTRGPTGLNGIVCPNCGATVTMTAPRESLPHPSQRGAAL